MNIDAKLIDKYNVPGPRYTSYPTVPFWNAKSFSKDSWVNSVHKIFAQQKNEGISIYIHLPYCESLCTFCGCHKHITKQHEKEAPYISTLLKEWQLYAEILGKKPLVTEIHLGGGTPTFFSAKNLKTLISGIRELCEFDQDIELGLEGHPNNTTEEHLRTLSEIGFKRISFGIQDYDTAVQKAINRIQTYEQVKKVHQLSMDYGFTSISHDLVFGLPLQTLDAMKTSIKNTLELKPHRISLYSYAHVPWIKGLGQRGYSESDLPSPEEKRLLYDTAKMMLLENGYYEIGMDHFALEEDELFKAYEQKKLHRNFMGYTTNNTKLLVGLGMSAISDSWLGFAQNAKSVKEYTQQIESGELAVFRGHMLNIEELVTRTHILELMCSFRTDISNLPLVQSMSIRKRLKPHALDGLVEIQGSIIEVTDLGKVFVRNICMCLDEHLQKNRSTEPMFSKTV